MVMTEFPVGRLDDIEFVVIFTRYKGKRQNGSCMRRLVS